MSGIPHWGTLGGKGKRLFRGGLPLFEKMQRELRRSQQTQEQKAACCANGENVDGQRRHKRVKAQRQARKLVTDDIEPRTADGDLPVSVQRQKAGVKRFRKGSFAGIKAAAAVADHNDASSGGGEQRLNREFGYNIGCCADAAWNTADDIAVALCAVAVPYAGILRGQIFIGQAGIDVFKKPVQIRREFELTLGNEKVQRWVEDGNGAVCGQKRIYIPDILHSLIRPSLCRGCTGAGQLGKRAYIAACRKKIAAVRIGGNGSGNSLSPLIVSGGGDTGLPGS